MDPHPGRKRTPSYWFDTPNFHGYLVLDVAELPVPEQAQVLHAVWEGADARNGGQYQCFEPWHGISARLDHHTYDLLICYHCAQIYAYIDGRATGWAVCTDRSPERILNAALAKHKARKDSPQCSPDHLPVNHGLTAGAIGPGDGGPERGRDFRGARPSPPSPAKIVSTFCCTTPAEPVGFSPYVQLLGGTPASSNRPSPAPGSRKETRHCESRKSIACLKLTLSAPPEQIKEPPTTGGSLSEAFLRLELRSRRRP